MRKFLVLAAMAAIFAMPTSSAEAGVLSSLLSFDGNPDIIDDDSTGNFRQVAGNTGDSTLEVGDLVQGMINFGPVDGNGIPAGQSVIGIYSLEITSIGTGGSSLSFGAATGAQSVNAIMAAAGVDTTGLSGSYLAQNNGFAILETTLAEVDGRSDFAGPVDATASGFGFTDANLSTNYSAVMTLGFDGVDDHHIVLPNFVGQDLTDLTIPNGLRTFGVTLAFFTGTYSITDSSFGSGVQFLPIFNPLTGAFGDVTIVNGQIASTDTDTDPNGWDFNDDGDFRINVVPEPGTAAMFACIGLIAVTPRRRK